MCPTVFVRSLCRLIHVMTLFSHWRQRNERSRSGGVAAASAVPLFPSFWVTLGHPEGYEGDASTAAPEPESGPRHRPLRPRGAAPAASGIAAGAAPRGRTFTGGGSGPEGRVGRAPTRRALRHQR